VARDWLNVDAVLAAASASPLPVPESPPRVSPGVKCRIGVASDAAFHFYYEENLRLLRDYGAELVAFSPLEHAVLPDVDGVYFGGGYPELHGFALETNATFRESVRCFIEAGGPVYAECGGLMYLTGAIRLTNGEVHRMVGAIAAESVMSDSLRAIGYVEAEASRDTILGPAGTRLRGHEFRHSELRNLALKSGADDAFVLTSPSGKRLGAAGVAQGNVLATYVHAHFASNPDAPRHFVERCARYRRERGEG
jgi:cobyrinic acid a,c-diamide synthase